MDPRMLQAGVAMGLGLLLFIPTFNALNNSYVENVTPPPWMPMPEEIPDDFEPPEDFELPEDFEPPEGDYEIPPEWRDKYKGKMPPGGCPPPVRRDFEEKTFQLPRPSTPLASGSWDEQMTLTPPQSAGAILLWANYTSWRAEEVRAAVEGPAGATPWDDSEPGDASPLNSQTEASASFHYNSYYTDNPDSPAVTNWTQARGKLLTPGEYTVTVSAENPRTGSVKIQGHYILACGGLGA